MDEGASAPVILSSRNEEFRQGGLSDVSEWEARLCKADEDVYALVLDLAGDNNGSLSVLRDEVKRIGDDIGSRLLEVISVRHEEFFKVVGSALRLELSVKSATTHLSNTVSQARKISDYIELHVKQYNALILERDEATKRMVR